MIREWGIVCDRNKTALRGYHRRQLIGLFPFLIPSPQKILHFFLGCRADGSSFLKFDLAAIRAAVRQRLCLKAVMADIAEIVGHSACTSNLRDVYVSSGYFSIPR